MILSNGSPASVPHPTLASRRRRNPKLGAIVVLSNLIPSRASARCHISMKMDQT